MIKIEIDCISYSIAADLYDNGSDKIILALPGWMSSKASYEPLISFIVNQAKTSALVIDYSGHGESPFDAMEVRPAQHFLEVITAFDCLKDHFPQAEISVMGYSYGGQMAALLTEYRDFTNLVLQVPTIFAPRSFYSRNKNIDRPQERRNRKDLEFLHSHPLLSRASQFKGKTLVMRHENDDNVPKELIDKYVEIFRADSYLAKGWGHGFNDKASEQEQLAYKKAITDLLNKTA